MLVLDPVWSQIAPDSVGLDDPTRYSTLASRIRYRATLVDPTTDDIIWQAEVENSGALTAVIDRAAVTADRGTGSGAPHSMMARRTLLVAAGLAGALGCASARVELSTRDQTYRGHIARVVVIGVPRDNDEAVLADLLGGELAKRHILSQAFATPPRPTSIPSGRRSMHSPPTPGCA